MSAPLMLTSALTREALGDGEYATLVETLLRHGYEQSKKLRRFQLVRQVPAQDGGGPIDVIVDFLMPRGAKVVKNDPPLIREFAVQRADGADLALRFFQMVVITGSMPTGGANQVEIAVCSIPALLAMKGHALKKRFKQKDAYDIYYSILNYPGGAEALAEECRPLLGYPSGAKGYAFIAEKFDTVDGYGPTCVRRFVQDTDILGDRTPDQWQVDAFGQVDAWLRLLGLRG